MALKIGSTVLARPRSDSTLLQKAVIICSCKAGKDMKFQCDFGKNFSNSGTRYRCNLATDIIELEEL